jgi:hypothetical protein
VEEICWSDARWHQESARGRTEEGPHRQSILVVSPLWTRQSHRRLPGVLLWSSLALPVEGGEREEGHVAQTPPPPHVHEIGNFAL